MKTSNQLLLTLLAFIFLAIVGTAMVLKTEFEKIDQKDPFYGYSREIVQPFKIVKLQGSYPGLIQLQPGDSFEVRVDTRHQGQVNWKIQGDTLTLSYPYPVEDNRYPEGYPFHRIPAVYIMAPQLTAVYAQGITCRLSGWQATNWTLQQEGPHRGMILTENVLENVSATVRQGGLIQLEANNQIHTLQAQVNDSSTFMARYGVIDSLQLRADSTANITLPGSLLNTVMP